MTADEFRSMALGFPEALESAHMNHPDFRTSGKIFATLGYPDDGWGMVKLTPEQQKLYVSEAPEVFVPCQGAWGRGGATSVHLALVKKNMLRAALGRAYHNVHDKLLKKDAPRRR